MVVTPYNAAQDIPNPSNTSSTNWAMVYGVYSCTLPRCQGKEPSLIVNQLQQALISASTPSWKCYNITVGAATVGVGGLTCSYIGQIARCTPEVQAAKAAHPAGGYSMR
jgi:hypothetical protein